VTLETVFLLSNLVVMPFWLLMIAFPKWRITQTIMQSWAIIAFLLVCYLVMLFSKFDGVVMLFTQMPELHHIMSLLGSREGAVIGWIHFLAFDLFVGRWIYLTSRTENRSVWVMGPILFFTLMLGPVGLLMFLMLQRIAPPESRR